MTVRRSSSWTWILRHPVAVVLATVIGAGSVAWSAGWAAPSLQQEPSQITCELAASNRPGQGVLLAWRMNHAEDVRAFEIQRAQAWQNEVGDFHPLSIGDLVVEEEGNGDLRFTLVDPIVADDVTYVYRLNVRGAADVVLDSSEEWWRYDADLDASQNEDRCRAGSADWTPTPTPTETPTFTPQPTNTPTPTRTNTPTWTPTPTRTATPTITPTFTPYPTKTPYPTPTFTRTPTFTPTPQPTPTFTSSPTFTPSPTETPLLATPTPEPGSLPPTADPNQAQSTPAAAATPTETPTFTPPPTQTVATEATPPPAPEPSAVAPTATTDGDSDSLGLDNGEDRSETAAINVLPAEEAVAEGSLPEQQMASDVEADTGASIAAAVRPDYRPEPPPLDRQPLVRIGLLVIGGLSLLAAAAFLLGALTLFGSKQ